MTHLAVTVLALYHALNPCKTGHRGVQEWFGKELRARGVTASGVSVHRWLRGTQDPGPKVMARVWMVVGELHVRAHTKALEGLRAVEAIVSHPHDAPHGDGR